jgi:hypothetical protein
MMHALASGGVVLFLGFGWAVAQGQLAGFVNHGLVGVGRIPADSYDQLGTQVDTLGGIGSAVFLDASSVTLTGDTTNGFTYSGTLYAMPDRGYGDGTQDYHPRIQVFRLTLTPYYGRGPVGQTQIAMSNVATIVLTFRGHPFTGSDPNDPRVTRHPQSARAGPGRGRWSLDPEGLVRTRDGDFFVSDEYGPFIYRFDPKGALRRTVQPPDAFLPKRGVYAGVNAFSGTNTLASGRVRNRGLEGLTLTPDGKRLVAMMQGPLTQDGGTNTASRNARILVFKLGKSSRQGAKLVGEYVYPLTLNGSPARDTQTTVSDILAVDDNRFFVLERDSFGLGATTNSSPLYKSINLVSLVGASNLAHTGYDLERGAPGQRSLPTSTLPSDVQPVQRQEFVSLLDPAQLARFGLNLSTNQDANTLAEKWEGLALMPLRDPAAPGDCFLLVASDNDFRAHRVYHNGRCVGTNAVAVDSLLLAFRVTLPLN